MLFLYLIETTEAGGYDQFEEAIVCAKSPAAARKIHPNGGGPDRWDATSWAKSPEGVTAKRIGIAARGIKENTVVLASFNAA